MSLLPRSIVVAALAVALPVGEAVAAPQAEVVVPPAQRAIDGNRGFKSIFRARGPRRLQVLIDARHLTALAGKQLSAIAFRKDVGGLADYAHLRGGESVDLEVRASWSFASASKPSMDFAANRGRETIVFDGSLVLPKVSARDARLAASFAPSEAPTLALRPGFYHQPNRTLVLEFVTRPGLTLRSWVWPVDAHTNYRTGTAKPLGKACWSAPTKPHATRVIEGSLRPGMHMRITSDVPAQPIASFLMFGLSDKLAYGAIPLPIRLEGTACDVFVSPDVLVPSLFFSGAMSTNAGWTGSVLPIPGDAGLYGARVYLQYLFLHHGSAGPAVKTGNGLALTMTQSPPALGASLVASKDTAASSGRVFLDWAPVLQLRAK